MRLLSNMLLKYINTIPVSHCCIKTQAQMALVAGVSPSRAIPPFEPIGG